MKIRTVKDLKKDLEKLDDDLIIVTSCDDEGNAYMNVYFEPTEGVMVDGEFISDEIEILEYGTNGVKCVCLN